MKMNNHFQYTFLTIGLRLRGTIIGNTLGESKPLCSRKRLL